MFFAKKAKQVFLTCLFILTTFNVFGQNKSNISIPRISGEINIDATLDEPQWKNATKVLVNNVTRPYDNIPSPVHTEALLMEDGGVLYIAFIAQDPNTSEIRAFLKDRDRAWGDDIVGIKIDTYNDQRTAYRFLVNPLGVQIDGIESEITKKESDAWDGIWDSSGRITDQGYIVEMALPLRMLNFNESLDIQKWGIELVRFYPRGDRLRLSNITIDRGNTCEICQMATAQGFENAKQGNNLMITPSLVIISNEEREDGSDWERDNEIEPGLDLRWGITPDILLNATINPDFSTVELDNAQLSINNNFALFFKEKRPFFLDNADYFDSDYNLIYTRNINAPDFGAKLTGRHNDHSFGLFVTDDTSTNILIPGNRSSAIAEIDSDSKAAALRYRYNYNKDITLGWVSTLRTADDYENSVHGVNANIRLSIENVFKFQSLFSNTEYPEDLYEQFCDNEDTSKCADPEAPNECDLTGCDFNEKVLRTQKDEPFNGNAFKVGFHHNDSKWHYRTTYQRQNEGFRGDLGFISRIDYNTFLIASNRKWYAEQGQWWTQFKIHSDWDISHNDNDELIEKEFDLNAQLNAQYESYFRLSYTHRDRVGSRIDKSSLAIDGNTTLFTEDKFSFFGEIKPVLGLYLNTQLTYGDEIDFANNRLGTVRQFRPTINWNVNKHLEVKLKQTVRKLDADGANVFIARLTDLRATYQFNVLSYIRFSIIYNNTHRNPDNYIYSDPEDIESHTKDFSTELLYAYKINPKTVFYLGYSDHHAAEEDFSDLEQDQRRVFMKFSYAWIK